MLRQISARLELLRPRALARMTKQVQTLGSDLNDVKRLLGTMAAEQQRADQRFASVIDRLDSLTTEVRQLSGRLDGIGLREAQLRAILQADVALEASLPALPAVLDEARIARHAADAIDRATLHLEPFPYILISSVFPKEFYRTLLRGIPPVEIFGDRKHNKQQLRVPFALAPEYSRRVWGFLTDVIDRTLQPLLVDKFRGPLSEWIVAHWPALRDDPFAPPMALNTSDGRIMLRGRGYEIPPHRDPKWGFLTGILYLARDTDSEQWGTQLYAVGGDGDARGAAPHWIDPARCRLVQDVPFRANSMLVFLNSAGAHGAKIPDDPALADLQRYIYQFRIGPTSDAIAALRHMLPEEQLPFWAGKL
jgi:hypothetical protein